MGILDRLSPTSQFIEVIEWLDDSSNTLLYRFPVKDQEIKNGAQLIVRETQVAVFVHEGQIADQFPPGRYTIDASRSVVTHHIEIASAPNYVGMDLPRTFALEGNRLTLRTPQRQLAGQTSSSTLIWERIE